MDDPRTQDALDSLADLFLTQTLAGKAAPASEEPATPPLEDPSPIRMPPKVLRTPSGPPPDPGPTQPSPFPGPAHEAPDPAPTDATPDESDAPMLRYTGEDEAHDGLGSPASAQAEAAEPIQQPAETDAGAPADLGLADAGYDDPARPAAAEAMVEAVVLGHLPGMAGPWLTQYAQLLADQTGPVLVVHVDEDDQSPEAGRIDLELVEPSTPEAASRGSVRVPPMRGSAPDLALGLIDAMVRARVGKVSTILVHLEADTDQRRLHRLLAIDDWTLLTGSDDMAVVGAYSLIKKLGEADARVAHKQIALMMMGCDDADGHIAAGKIAQAADSFLQAPTMLLGSHPRLGPVNVRQLGTFNELGKLWPKLLAYLEDLTPAAQGIDTAAPPSDEWEIEVPSEAETTPTPPAPDRPKEAAFESIMRVPRNQPPPRLADPTTTPTTPSVPPRRIDIAPIPPSAPEKTTSDGPAKAMPVSGDAPRLAELVAAGAHGITGGVALEARCPYQPMTELVLDHAGRLHLLRRELQVETSETDESAGIRAAVVDLAEAGKWVREHLELLKLTMRDADFDSSAEPSLHLFTAKAHLATPIVAKLGDQVKLHLLQEVQVGLQNAWFCTPLN